jgi:hypothetical protein
MEKYLAAMTDLGLRLTRLIALALGLPEGFFDNPGMFDKPSVFLRPLHYTGTIPKAYKRRPHIANILLFRCRRSSKCLRGSDRGNSAQSKYFAQLAYVRDVF